MKANLIGLSVRLVRVIISIVTIVRVVTRSCELYKNIYKNATTSIMMDARIRCLRCT